MVSNRKWIFRFLDKTKLKWKEWREHHGNTQPRIYTFSDVLTYFGYHAQTAESQPVLIFIRCHKKSSFGTLNQGVQGSTPCRRTLRIKELARC